MSTTTDDRSLAWMDTPIGTVLLREEQGELKEIRFHARPRPRAVAPTPLLREVIRQLEQYFAGRRTAFDLPLSPDGTMFQKQVWHALLRIPYGTTRSYGEIARALQRPTASRAVGAANGRNPIPIVIPCHRVIGANGRLVGYGGGLSIKEKLLKLEAAHTPKAESPGLSGMKERQMEP